MLFLDLLFCGQTHHRSKYLGCAPFGQKLQMQPMPFFTAPAAPIQKMQILLRYISAISDIYLRYIFYLTFKSKFSGKIFLRSKSSRCNLTFFSVNLFWDGADLKSPPFCHQNPLWKAHSCNLCRNDAENFPSKPSPDEQASVGKPWHMWTAKRLHIYFMNQ